MERKIVFYCNTCNKRMPLVMGAYSAFRRCPNYLRENRKANEKACMNRLNLRQDVRKIREVINRYEEEGILEKGIYVIDTANLSAYVDECCDAYVKVKVDRKYRSRYKQRGHK